MMSNPISLQQTTDKELHAYRIEICKTKVNCANLDLYPKFYCVWANQITWMKFLMDRTL